MMAVTAGQRRRRELSLAKAKAMLMFNNDVGHHLSSDMLTTIVIQILVGISAFFTHSKEKGYVSASDGVL